MPAPELNAVVTQRIEAASGLIILKVAPVGWRFPDFRAGQFVVIGLPAGAPRVALSDPEPPPADPAKLVRRAYSIASSPLASGEIEFYVTLVRSGELTPRLFALQPGDKLWLGPKPTGLFTLADIPADRHLVMVATGTGLAPYMSMLRTHLASAGERRIAAIVGARHSWDIAYSAELTTMQRLSPRFTWIPVVSRPAEEPVPWGGETGHVQEIWRRKLVGERWGFAPAPANAHVLLCGSPGMIDEMTAMLVAEGYAADVKGKGGQVHAERYW
jgi:ferredoxin--NADP+ reductase